MILLPLLVVFIAVAAVYVTRRRHTHAMATGSSNVSSHHAATISPIGRWSLVTLAAGLVFWIITRTTLPIYYVATIGGLAFVLAVVAVVYFHDRSPLLLFPLLLVPLASAATIAFVVLQ